MAYKIQNMIVTETISKCIMLWVLLLSKMLVLCIMSQKLKMLDDMTVIVTNAISALVQVE